MVGLVTATLAVVIGPWVGLWVARWARNYFIGVLACLVGTVVLGWLVVWLLSVLTHRWALGEWRILVWPIDGAAVSIFLLVVPPIVQVVVGIAAVRAVRRWVSGGGTGQRGA